MLPGLADWRPCPGKQIPSWGKDAEIEGWPQSGDPNWVVGRWVEGGSVAEGPRVEGDVAGWPRACDEADMAAVGRVGEAAGG